MGTLSSLEILIVEDNGNVRNAITSLLRKCGYSVEAVADGGSALERLQKKFFDLVVSDYRMGDIDGIQLLRHIKEQWPATEVVIITAFGTIAKGVEAIKIGAFDYMTKPFDPDELLRIVSRFVEEKKDGDRIKDLSVEVRKQAEFDPIIGKSDKIMALMDIVARIAAKESSILIYGESGTGKELIAKSIHALSPRNHKPFIPINCGAIPENLQESELFGHIRGAFTSANFEKKGLFEVAHGGTIFLDEIADMSLSTQVTLLRCLQENEIRRIGESFTREVDVRVIVATNKSLVEEVKEGRFREDLYYRINVIPLNLPPLRERKEDIPLLVDHFIEKYREKNQSPVKKISRRTKSMFMNYDWPGNVRELENAIHRGVALGTTSEITPDLVPVEIKGRPDDAAGKMKSRVGNLAQIEKEVIGETLARMDGNKKKTAEALGISKATLWRKLKN